MIDGVRRVLEAVGIQVSASLVSPGPGQALEAEQSDEGEFPGARMGRTP